MLILTRCTHTHKIHADKIHPHNTRYMHMKCTPHEVRVHKMRAYKVYADEVHAYCEWNGLGCALVAMWMVASGHRTGSSSAVMSQRPGANYASTHLWMLHRLQSFRALMRLKSL
jgi:hypothetical protein